MKKYIIILILTLSIISTSAQTRSGLAVGFQYETTSHTNPYVKIDNGTFQSFEDKTNFLYFPFNYGNYSKNGFSELSTNAFHLLLVGAVNLISPSKEYVISTDRTYSGDSYADGYIPIFDDFEAQTKQYWGTNSQEGIEASFNDTYLLRYIFAGSLKNTMLGLPVLFGIQGEVGQMGVHFSKVRDGHEPSPIKSAGSVTGFNDGTVLTFGANTGYVTELLGNDLAIFSIQYDWYYFIKGVSESGEERMLNGNKLTFELTYFPFDNRQEYLNNLHFKFLYKTSTVPYMKEFSDTTPIDYEFTKIGLSINYFIL